MVTTALQICNAALLNTGTSISINAFDARTAESRACNVIYEPTRDALLERFPWKFATRRKLLAPLADAAHARSGWAYSYALPSDCIIPQYVYPGLRSVNALDKIPFATEASGLATPSTMMVLLTDRADAELVYTSRNDNVAMYSPLFVETLAWALAVKLCLVLPVKPEWAKNCKAGLVEALLIAKSVHMRGQQEDPNPPSEYTTRR